MKQCISRLIHLINHLWRTLLKYVRKKKYVRMEDVDHDGIDELILDPNGLPATDTVTVEQTPSIVNQEEE